jgi:hypothetical protein
MSRPSVHACSRLIENLGLVAPQQPSAARRCWPASPACPHTPFASSHLSRVGRACPCHRVRRVTACHALSPCSTLPPSLRQPATHKCPTPTAWSPRHPAALAQPTRLAYHARAPVAVAVAPNRAHAPNRLEHSCPSTLDRVPT